MNDQPAPAVHPTAFLAAWAILSWALTRLWPISFVPGWAEEVLLVPLVVVGILVWVWGAVELHRHDTSLDHGKPTTALVTTGPFRFSRNPLYLGLLLTLAGLALGHDSLWAFLLLLPAAVATQRFSVTPEEAELERRFGDTYRTYRASVRQWL